MTCHSIVPAAWWRRCTRLVTAAQADSVTVRLTENLVLSKLGCHSVKAQSVCICSMCINIWNLASSDSEQ
jgi:hypothetical protein